MATVVDLGKKVKAKYPEYQSMSDLEIGRKVKAKYPEYQSFEDVADTPAQPEKGIVDKGVDFVKSSLSDAYKAGGEAVDAGGKLASNIGAGNVFTDENAGLAADVIGKGLQAATPLAPLAIGAGIATVGAVPTAIGVGTGLIAGKLGSMTGEGLAKLAGGSENVQRLASEVGGLAGGGTAGTKAVQAAARRAGALGSRVGRAADPAVKQAAQKVAQRLDEVSTIENTKRSVFEGAPDRLSSTDKVLGALVEDTLPATKVIRKHLKDSGTSKEETREFMTNLDNDAAQARRPDTLQISVIEGTQFEKELKNLAKFRVGDVSGLEQFDRWTSALRENERVAKDPNFINQLPGVGGAARVAENDKIIQAFQNDFAPIKKELDTIVREGIVKPAVEDGLISKAAAARMGTFDEYSKWIRPMTDLEKEAMAGRGSPQLKPVMGMGSDDPTPFLKTIQLREPKPVIQATVDQMQVVAKTGARNRMLRRIADEASQFDPATQAIKKGRLFPDMLVVPGSVESEAFAALPDSIKSTTGTARLLVDGKEHTLVGPPATMNAMNSFDQISGDVAIKMWPWLRSVSGMANRGFKLTTTGALAPARKGLNMAYNLAQVYQQLPLAASTPAILRGAKYGMEFLAKELSEPASALRLPKFKGGKEFQRIRKEGLDTSSIGSSTEMIRGVGEKNIDLVAAKGDPEEFFRFVMWDPARELGKAVTGKKFDRNVVKRFGLLADDGLRFIEDVLSSDEVGLKMGVYDTMQKYYTKQGKSPATAKSLAAWDARNVITDFTRRGTFTRNFDMLGLPFAQAAVTGMRTNAMYAYQDPMGFAARTAAPVAAHMMLTAANYADPRKARILSDIPDEVQAKSMIFITDPDKVTKDERGRYTGGLVVVPFLESPFARAGAAAGIQVLKQQTPVENASTALMMWDAARKGSAQFLPFEPDPIAIASGIPIAGPLAQIARNQDTFTKAPVVSPKTIRRTPAWIQDALGGNKELAAKAHYFLRKSAPSFGKIGNSPQSGDDSTGLSEYFRQLVEPITSVPGGAIRRRERDR